jgi:hypothetical protein
MDETSVEHYLSRTPPGLKHPILSKEEAAVRAKVVCDDMKAIGLELEIKTHIATFGGGLEIEVAYYDLPRPDFGKSAPDPTSGSAAFTALGIGYTWGDLFQLSKACMNGRRLLSDKVWPLDFQEDLLNNRHYSCVQELLWLGRFKNALNVLHAAKPFPNSAKDVDWRFKSDGQVINLEVKYRPADWTKLVDGPAISPSRVDDFHDVFGKFPTKREDELNLLAVTSVAPLDDSIDVACRELLKEIPTLDGVFIWTHAPEHGYTRIISNQRGFVRLFFNEGDAEDRMFLPVILHQWALSAMRQGKMPGEVNQELEERHRQRNDLLNPE